MVQQPFYGPVQMPQVDPSVQGQSDVTSIPAMDSQTGDVIRWQLETSRHLLGVENRLRGAIEVYDARVGDYVSVVDAEQSKPLMNDLGVSRVMSVMRNVIDPNTILSSYDKEEAYTAVIEIVQTILDMLFLEYERYAVSKSDLPIIRNIVENGVKSCLFRSVNATTLDYLRGSQRTIMTTVSGSGGGGRPGLLGRLGSAFHL